MVPKGLESFTAFLGWEDCGTYDPVNSTALLDSAMGLASEMEVKHLGLCVEGLAESKIGVYTRRDPQDYKLEGIPEMTIHFAPDPTASQQKHPQAAEDRYSRFKGILETQDGKEFKMKVVNVELGAKPRELNNQGITVEEMLLANSERGYHTGKCTEPYPEGRVTFSKGRRRTPAWFRSAPPDREDTDVIYSGTDDEATESESGGDSDNESFILVPRDIVSDDRDLI